MVYGITLIILGLLAAPSLLLSKKPNAKELLDKIIPYQGWAGFAFCIWGILGTVFTLIAVATYFQFGVIGIISWVIQLFCCILEAVLGFLLGYPLLVKYLLSKNEAAKEKGAQLLAKLQPLQGKIGLVAIITGIVCIIFSILYAAAVTAAAVAVIAG